MNPQVFAEFDCEHVTLKVDTHFGGEAVGLRVHLPGAGFVDFKPMDVAKKYEYAQADWDHKLAAKKRQCDLARLRVKADETPIYRDEFPKLDCDNMVLLPPVVTESSDGQED